MKKNYYAVGQHNFICDVCGQKLKSGIARKRWDGLMVCPEDWEIRHPQDFIKVKADVQTVPWSRPKQTDVFNTVFGINESLSLSDSFSRVIETYSTLSDTITLTEDVLLAESEISSLSDTITLTEGGSIEVPLYIDVTYFASDFMETTRPL